MTHPLLWIAGAGAIGVLAHGLFVPSSPVFTRPVTRLPKGDARVALTFDDGPWPETTPRILDALAARGAKASFFVIGQYVERHPDLVRRMSDEGHLVGNHTWDHHRLGLCRGWSYWRDQVRRTDDMIESVIGTRPTWFRAPMGFKAPPLVAATSVHRIVAWSRRASDGSRPSSARIIGCAERLRDGDIALLHDGRDPSSHRDAGVTASAVPEVLEILSRAGLRSVRLDDAP